MNLRFIVVMSALAALLSACATPPQISVRLAPAALATPGTRIGVFVAPMPKIDTTFPGANCLVCLAFAASANSALTTRVVAFQYEKLRTVNDNLVSELESRSVVAVAVDPLALKGLASFSGDGKTFARKDFRELKSKYNIDKLIVVSISAAGVSRQYANYNATGNPMAHITGSSYMVNLTTNALEWYLPIGVIKPSDGEWDEQPDFPGLSDAFSQAQEMARDQILRPIKK